ncbi:MULTISPECIES: DUF2938 domain-containing protein [unclassified Pseudoxanthomonas]|uniref:DUF2938 domain-containing protein n=1 Tax=unclassified Pseudoxanthomonas TaxID=2645906 RepID=UPI001849CF2F|nr:MULTISPECIES: DUF2938 domain-containing protein [unclassified Pseudoxanthomonas]MBB3275768.1 hypothetical protein [Pseudoxanthomonas sp. OG2]MBV7473147.1 DUF2938 domain-containing protein [Pseudoxanthomonas sp. PXM05]
MMPPSEFVVHAIVLGLGATALMDAWIWLRQRWLGVPGLNYTLLGRWVAWLPRGRFLHDPIAATPPVHGERVIGIAAHVLTGIVFAAILLVFGGEAWLRAPTLPLSLMVGIGSVVAPFLMMQPGMGLGIAARRAPHPGRTRLHSLVTHAMFGVGLYLSGKILSWMA